MKRRTLRGVAKVILLVWTMGVSLAAAQICWGTTAQHSGGRAVSEIATSGTGERANPANPDIDCPPAPDANVDSGNADWADDLLAAIAIAPVLHIQPFVDALVVRAERFRHATPTSIPAYLVAHRLRF